MESFDYSDEKQAELFEAIYLGLVSVSTLPEGLYTETANVLKKSLYKGYGGTLLDFKFGSPDYELLKELRENIYIFSAAKTATQVTEIRDLMFEGKEVVSLFDFKKKALVMFKGYNENYLESEYITANTSGSSAANWNYTQQHKDLFTRLRSVAIIDSNTAIECERMNGVVAPVDDPIWNHNISPRHFRCRCHEERLDKYDKDPSTPKSERESIMKQNDASMQDVFKMNPGKDRYVFSPEHAYFDIGKKYKVLARKNFGLKIPEVDTEILKEAVSNVFKPVKSIEEFEDRARKLGIKQVTYTNLKKEGVKLDFANPFLDALESEASIKPINLDRVDFYGKSDFAAAAYSPSNNSIYLNITNGKKTAKNLEKGVARETRQQRIDKAKALKTKWQDEYLGKPNYNQMKVVKEIRKISNIISELQNEIDKGLPELPFTVGQTEKTLHEKIKTTITHELGHYRHFKDLKSTQQFNFNQQTVPSDYAKTNFKEYFAEWFAKYRRYGAKDVPSDLLKLFKSIEDAKP